jgi:hypothetical protein
VTAMPRAATAEAESPALDRAALRAAISAARQSTAALAAQQSAVHRAGEVVGEIEREITKAAAAVPAAESTTTSMREAREQREELGDRLVLARAAVERLREQLKQKELDAAFAANAVVCARSELLAPVAAAVLARIKAARVELLRDRVLLAALISDNGAPEFANDPRSFFQIREAEANRRKAFGDVRAEAAADAIDLSAGPRGHSIEEAGAVMPSHAKWTKQLVDLLTDANAKLPGEM